MLELKNIKKEYVTKTGIKVKALDDVSINFEDKGLVFLLGKSGSGKSTLLNIIGGLDKFDNGDIIFKDISCKNFKQKDFDSYRNTHIGFIFQSYNLFNQYSIEDNISIALELQGKKINKDLISNSLKNIDLEGFEKRKPKELSGGQQQRVAIARALVKDPTIILADEPTGALDYNTGKNILQKLKDLSKDKLVIVVTHDNEFAETYGDRIIELKDGKIIDDRKPSKIKSNEIFKLKNEAELVYASMKNLANNKKFVALVSNFKNIGISDKNLDIHKLIEETVKKDYQIIFSNEEIQNVNIVFMIKDNKEEIIL